MHSDPAGPGYLDTLLAELWRLRGTDVMLTCGVPPVLRVDGEMRPQRELPVLDEAAIDAVLRKLLTPAQFMAFAQADEYDFSFSWQEAARIRGNAFRQRGQTAVALRMIPREIPSMDRLGLPPVLQTFLARHQGLLLVTGPTGSGKSTTLAAMVEWINAHQARHILTIEDPIEYVHDHRRSVINQREVGTDTADFPAALRSALREDPDVLLVGEMRDLESIQFALTIAETGHLVLATLHTNDTAQALSRIVDVFPAERQTQIRVQLAAALSAIVYQRLLPQAGGGMVAAHEVLVATPAVRNLIREGKTAQLRNALVTGHKDGMVSFEQSLSALVGQGTVSYQDAVAHSLHPRDVEPAPKPVRATA